MRDDELHALPGFRAGPSVLEAASGDWSSAPRALPRAVLRPETVEDLARALAACNRARQPVVPQGGLTGLAGGANPRAGDVALSLAGLSGVIGIDRDARTLTCLAGTTLQAAQEAAASEGLMLPIDLGARGSCMIGGNIATNAGGLRVIRHGTTRANVLGLEAVLADGSIVGGLRTMVKSALGPDLGQLMIGSEGTLGVVTRAVLRLAPMPAARLTALCALPDFAAVLRLLSRARNGLAGLSAFEAMWPDYLGWNAADLGVTLFPEAPPLAVILEAESGGSPAEAEAFETLLEAAFETGEITDAILPKSDRELAGIWAVREAVGMDRAMPGLVNLDVSLPPARLGAFAEAAAARLAEAFGAQRSFRFGHVGDGNLHLCVHVPGLGPEASHAVEAVVYPLLAGMGGLISAEHGIGTLKRDWLGLSRGADDLAALRAVKGALDPHGILNPGKVLPA